MAEEKKDRSKRSWKRRRRLSGVPGTPMTPEEAQENKRQVEEEQKRLAEVPEGGAQRAAGSEINKPPTAVASGNGSVCPKALEKESGESKAKRVDTADVDPEGEKAPAGWGKKPTVYVMTNVDGEKLYVTVKQWASTDRSSAPRAGPPRNSQRAIPAAASHIPGDIDWGKDKRDDAAAFLFCGARKGGC